MPTIAMFLGILISMKYNDHLPPHFHAWYSGHEAKFTFDGDLLEGEMPNTQAKKIKGWALLHEEELLADWHACRRGEEPFRIGGIM